MCREMKDSGIEWIGEIPREKSIINLKHVLSYIKGKNPNEINDIGKGKPYIGASDLDKDRGYLEYKNYCDEDLPCAEKEDVLVLWDGARAGLIGTNHEGYISSTIVKILPNIKYIKKRFFYWYLRGAEKYLFEQVRGTTIPHMSREFIDNMGMIDFSLNEQEQIVKYLDKKVSEIDDIILKQKSLIEKYKAYKQSLITETVTKGLNKNVSMKDSGIEWIGEIPKHWDITKISNIAEVGSGGTPNRQNKELWNGNINWMSSGEVNMQYVYETKEKITESGLNSISSPLLPVNTVMLGLIGQGKTKGMTAILCVESACNQNLAYCICKKEIYHHKYLFYSFKAMYKFLRGVIGESQAGIYLGFLKECKIIVPSIEEQKEITDFLDKKCEAIDSAISKKEQLIEKLESYKKSLIYECVTGKREVN